MNGTNIRNSAMWLGLLGVALGTVAILAAFAGDLRIAIGWGAGIAAIGLFIGLVGALFAQYRPMAASLLLVAGVFGVLIGQWSEISQWTVDLWTSGTGGIVAYVDANGVGRTLDFWGVLFGSVSALAYAGAVLFGAIAAIVAAFAPEPERDVMLRPATAPHAL